MCGRYTLTVTLAELMMYYERGQSLKTLDHAPRYNIAPTQKVLAIIHDAQKRRLGKLRWGLIPHWANEENIGAKLINARHDDESCIAPIREQDLS